MERDQVRYRWPNGARCAVAFSVDPDAESARQAQVDLSEDHVRHVAQEDAVVEGIHPAVDRAFGGARPPGEPEVHHLDVIDIRGEAVPKRVQ